MSDCSCKHMPTDCPSGSAWNGNECICLPPSGGCSTNYSWHYHECRCVCDPHPDDCGDNAALTAQYGYTFDASRTWFWDQCECACAATPIDCPADTGVAHYIYSSLTGDCLCSPGPQGCGANQYFDTDTCECRCSPMDCNDGFEWDVDACECKCN